MGLNPNKLKLSKQKLYLPVTQFNGLVPGLTITKGGVLASGEIGVSADSATATINNNAILATLHLPDVVKTTSAQGTFATAATLEEINGYGVVGLKMNTAGQKVSHLMYLPNDWDRRNGVNVRVLWTSGSSTPADTIDWIFTYAALSVNHPVITLNPTEQGLDTVIAQDTVIGSYRLQQTEAGVINSLQTTTSPQDSRLFKFTVENDAFAAGLTEDKFLLGVEFEYTLRLGRNIQSAGSDPTFFQEG